MANPDLILHNGRIYTGPDSGSRVAALAIWNGRITDVGSDRDMLPLKGRSVEKLDLEGKTVVPGFTDSHMHLLGYGMVMQNVDLKQARSVADVRLAVASVARKRGREAWVEGRGWDQEKLKEHRFLQKTDIDGVATNPVLLKRVCGHIATANSAALAVADIDRFTCDPEGGEIVRDPSSGDPTGVLKENAIGLVQEKIHYREDTVESALEMACRKLLKLGLTSLHCIIQDAQELRVLRRLKEEGRVQQSIYAILPSGLLDQAAALGLSTERDASGFRIGGVKVFMDGSLGARTAALLEPYSDEPTTLGLLTVAPEKLRGSVEKMEAAGLQLCVHAIGDRAVETFLNVVEEASEPRKGLWLRHRIEHCSLANPRTIARMKRLGIVASVQPSFIKSDTWAKERLGERRTRYLYPFRSMLTKGIPLAAGSDCPVEDPNPFEGIWSAVARPGLSTDEKLTVGEAIGIYTQGAAYASHSEFETGSLEPRKRADMVILDKDPFEAETDSLRSIHVVHTMVSGHFAS